MIEVKFDDTEIKKALQALQRKAGDISPALREINEILLESTKQRFSSATTPDGTKWEDNADSTIARKGRNQPLVDGKDMMREIHGDIGNDALLFGSSMEYAAMMQFGGTKSKFPDLWGDIPARPFLGISGDDETDILTILERHLSL